MSIKQVLARGRRRLSATLLVVFVGGYVVYRSGLVLRLVYRTCGIVVHALPRGLRGRWQARRRRRCG
jgi:hypothetical protein